MDLAPSRTASERRRKPVGWLLSASGLAAIALIFPAHAALPTVPVPPENPLTEEKRVLGKILFWDEQLSSDNTVACGTCHKPGVAGADDRVGLHPGKDGRLGTDDDILGSPGIRRLNHDGVPEHDALYGDNVQVTDRRSPSYFGALWSETQFWDGRAASQFVDPETGAVAIRKGGSLESQSLQPLMNSAEMARADRDWGEVTAKLRVVAPLALADRIPADMRTALDRDASYPALFERAFGDPAISTVRIAFAIASYERTLVADQTPWDLYDASAADAAPPTWRTGLTWFETHNCHACHTPPLFTNNEFASVGLGMSFHNQGRAAVTHRKQDDGDMKVPSLRNVGLRSHFMHTGRLQTWKEVFDLYADPKEPFDPLPSGEPYVVRMTDAARSAIEQFLRIALTDPRVAAESFPFDRPRLRSERYQDDHEAPSAPADIRSRREGRAVTLQWTAATDDTGVVDYELRRNGKVIAVPTQAAFIDAIGNAPWIYRYELRARDAKGNVSAMVSSFVWPTSLALSAAGLIAVLTVALLMRRIIASKA